MAWNEEESSRSRSRRNRNIRRGCTIKKSVLVASCLLVVAALVAFYVALVCQRMDLTVVNATATGLKVIPHPSNTAVSLHHNATSHHIDLSTNASAPMSSSIGSHTRSNGANSSFYLSKVALTLSLLFNNPTPSMGTYHYHPLHWQLSYHNINIANGSTREFSKGSHDAYLPIELHLTGRNVTLPRAVASDLRTNHSILNFHASTTVKVHLLRNMVDFEFPVSCNLSFPHPSRNGKTQLLSKTSCLVKAA